MEQVDIAAKLGALQTERENLKRSFEEQLAALRRQREELIGAFNFQNGVFEGREALLKEMLAAKGAPTSSEVSAGA